MDDASKFIRGEAIAGLVITCINIIGGILIGTLQIGYGLVYLADENRGGDLLARIKNLRKHLAQELGIMVPPVHGEYSILIKGVEVAKGELMPNLTKYNYVLIDTPSLEKRLMINDLKDLILKMPFLRFQWVVRVTEHYEYILKLWEKN